MTAIEQAADAFVKALHQVDPEADLETLTDMAIAHLAYALGRDESTEGRVDDIGRGGVNTWVVEDASGQIVMHISALNHADF